MVYKVLTILIPLLLISICLIKGSNPFLDIVIEFLVEYSKDARGVAHCNRACIISIEGGVPWTTDLHVYALKLQASERESIAEVFKSKNLASFQSKGISVEGILYQNVTEGDDKLVLGKKAGHGSVTLKATKKAIVIAHGSDKSSQEHVVKAVSSIADFLKYFGL